MYWTQRVGQALKLAYDLHHEQTDKSGLPYIFHPYRVAEKMEKYLDFDRESLTIVALLHDVLEDSGLTTKELAQYACAYGFALTKDELRWIEAVTRRKGERYDDFITRTMEENESRIVKFEDVADNLNREIFGAAMSASLVERYEKAYNRLMGL